MAGEFDLGQWLSEHNPFSGGSSAPGVKSQYVQNGPGGLHQFSVMTDGSLQDNGIIDPKAAAAKTQIVKDDAGGVYAFTPSGDPNQPFTQTTLVPPDATKADLTQSSVDKNNADVQDIYGKLAAAQAMLPYNKEKAGAMVANLQSEVANRGARTQIDQEKLAGQLGRWASQNSLDPAKIGLIGAQTNKNNAQTSLYTAEGQMKLQNSFFAVQQQVNTLNSMVGKPGGPATQQEADALAAQLYDRAALEAATGITAADAAKNALTVQRQQVDQANNRASQASSVFNNSGNIAMDAAKNGAGGPAATGGFLAMLNAAPQFQNNMGGAPVNIQNAAVTPDHIKQIAQLVTSGQAPADANGNRFANAVKMVAQNNGVLPPDGGPPSVANGGVAAPVSPPSTNGNGFLGSLSGQSFGGIPVSSTGTDLGVFPG